MTEPEPGFGSPWDDFLAQLDDTLAKRNARRLSWAYVTLWGIIVSVAALVADFIVCRK